MRIETLIGSIPACAGKPPPAYRSCGGCRVHPRVCGEARVAARVFIARLGSIPACAGKPASAAPGPDWAGVHPRVCGEARRVCAERSGAWGPSPRVRGSPPRGSARSPRAGSIPACAGKPGPAHRRRRGQGVHPRVCGEARSSRPARSRATGPSPRVRGSPNVVDARIIPAGSIPACAGKPRPRSPGGIPPGVHPRVCGEALTAPKVVSVAWGPSPRVRGSRPAVDAGSDRIGSIPACAGKPPKYRPGRRSPRVHPRVCGEASSIRGQGMVRPGPSPRVRGSHRGAPHAPRAGGSIPACAGKPGAGKPMPLPWGVHPRVCGEAEPGLRPAQPRLGPSPRVRGSPDDNPIDAEVDGSIPACAGKPQNRCPASTADGVHPRVCGEATTGSSSGR